MADEALRYDTGKDPWCLLPFDGLRELVGHYKRGADKYARRNWEKGMAYSRCFDSLMRHLTAWWAGEEWDIEYDENGVEIYRARHLTAVVWNSMALLVYSLRGIGTDDRPVSRAETPPSVVYVPRISILP